MFDDWSRSLQALIPVLHLGVLCADLLLVNNVPSRSSSHSIFLNFLFSHVDGFLKLSHDAVKTICQILSLSENMNKFNCVPKIVYINNGFV